MITDISIILIRNNRGLFVSVCSRTQIATEYHKRLLLTCKFILVLP